jgi:hypothetical protein
MTTIPKRSKWRIALLCFAAVVSICMLTILVWGVMLYRWAHKPAPLVLSKETTFITEPLRLDGSVDYVAALNKQHSRGVTSANNGAVLFWRAIGPNDVAPVYREEFFQQLGIPPVAEDGNYFVSLSEFVKSSGSFTNVAERLTAESPPQEDVWGDRLETATKVPWSNEEFPKLIQWLTVNEKPMSLVNEASQRHYWFNPLVSDDGTMLGARVAGAKRSQEVVRAFVARAMHRVQTGQLDAAWNDLLTCHRLARLFGQGSTLIDALVSGKLDEIACMGDQTLLQHAHLDADQIARIRDDLNGLAPSPAMAEKFATAERMFFLDGALGVARTGIGTLRILARDGGPDAVFVVDLASLATIDWNIVLHVGNSWFDRIVAAHRLPLRSQQLDALRQINGELILLGRGSRKVPSLMRSMLSDPQEAASERVGQILVTILMPAVSVTHATKMQGDTRFELVKLGFALAAYRAEHDSYPATLAELIPKYVAETPLDAFSDAEMRYDRQHDGYLLYSVGVNAKDDGGQSLSDEQDDLAIRVPAVLKD